MPNQQTFKKVDENDANFENRAVLRLIQNQSDGRNPLVILSLPSQDGRSQPIPVNDAQTLMVQWQRLTPDFSNVDVIDPDGLWPEHWAPLVQEK